MGEENNRNLDEHDLSSESRAGETLQGGDVDAESRPDEQEETAEKDRQKLCKPRSSVYRTRCCARGPKWKTCKGDRRAKWTRQDAFRMRPSCGICCRCSTDWTRGWITPLKMIRHAKALF